jgi:hypothetical protein
MGNSTEKCGLGSSSSGQQLAAGFCRHSNEPTGSIKGADFFDYMSVFISFS